MSAMAQSCHAVFQSTTWLPSHASLHTFYVKTVQCGGTARLLAHISSPRMAGMRVISHAVAGNIKTKEGPAGFPRYHLVGGGPHGSSQGFPALVRLSLEPLVPSPP